MYIDRAVIVYTSISTCNFRNWLCLKNKHIISGHWAAWTTKCRKAQLLTSWRKKRCSTFRRFAKKQHDGPWIIVLRKTPRRVSRSLSGSVNMSRNYIFFSSQLVIYRTRYRELQTVMVSIDCTLMNALVKRQLRGKKFARSTFRRLLVNVTGDWMMHILSVCPLFFSV